MIILNCIRKTFRTWCRSHLTWLLPLLIFQGASSCRNGKTISNDHTNTSSTASQNNSSQATTISQQHFRADAIVLGYTALSEKIMYMLLLENISGRGSSLFWEVAKGDTLIVESYSTTSVFQKNTMINALIEERLQLNSEKPLFLIKDIQKK